MIAEKCGRLWPWWIRTAKSLFETRPIFRKLDETIRGHVSCGFHTGLAPRAFRGSGLYQSFDNSLHHRRAHRVSEKPDAIASRSAVQLEPSGSPMARFNSGTCSIRSVVSLPTPDAGPKRSSARIAGVWRSRRENYYKTINAVIAISLAN
jgi:hypothetical protein